MIPRVVLDLKSTLASSGRSVDGNVMKPDQRDFSGNVEGPQITASSKIHSRTDLNRIDETRGNITIEEGDLMVNKKNIDRQSHTHHRNLPTDTGIFEMQRVFSQENNSQKTSRVKIFYFYFTEKKT